MKIMTPVLLIVFLVAPSLFFGAWGGDNPNGSDNGHLVVTGIGYPPIKAQNAAQARLMARRAAVLDAYRNALAGSGTANGDEKAFYSGLSGFVKGLVIENEEYLEDGGIRILARVPLRDVTVSAKASRSDTDRQGRKPSPVPLKEWYKIIENSVKFE
jgi:hypothetical protein